MTLEQIIARPARTSFVNALLKKTAFTGTDTYISVYVNNDPAQEYTNIARKNIPVDQYTVEQDGDGLTKIFNNQDIYLGPFTTAASISGYLFWSTITDGVNFLAVPLPAAYDVNINSYIKIPTAGFTINVSS